MTTVESPLWTHVDALLSAATPTAAAIHGLGSLYARVLRSRGLSVPERLANDEQSASIRMLTVGPLLERIRGNCTGPLVLMKGAEVALRYPDAARSFSDIDLLVPEPRRTRRELLEAGFEEVGDPELFYRIHHLRPLAWPSLPVSIEVHSAPKWPARLPPADVSEIIAAASASRLGVDGILAPSPAQHALLLAAHAWAHEPLLRVRDLVDVTVMAEEAATGEVDALARHWHLYRLWRATKAAADAVLGRRRASLAVRLWGRHLPELRERTVFENHLQAWLSGYWSLPAPSAFAQTAAAFREDLLPAPEEGWRDKVERSTKALRRAGSPLSHHNLLLGDAATRGQRRNDPDEDDLADASGD